MKWQFTAAIGVLMTALNVWSQPVALYENFGNNDFGDNPPQIDALSFANYGTFSVFTLVPYDTQNTLNFTNRGTMIGNPGFEFDTAFTTGARKRAANFVNQRGATVDAGTHLRINATNVLNQGTLEVGGAGLLSIQGERVDLSRGVLLIPSDSGGIGFPPAFPDTGTNFFPEPGVTDLYWGAGETNIATQDIVDFLETPIHWVTNAGFFAGGQLTFFGLNPFTTFAFTFTNSIGSGTNTTFIAQIALIDLGDTNMVPVARFEEGYHPFLRLVNMGFSSSRTNVMGDLETSHIFLSDGLAALTNTIMSTNLDTFPIYTYRPYAYSLTRSDLSDFGDPGNAPFSFDYIYNEEYASSIVTNLYAAYSAEISDQLVELPQVPDVGSDQLPGRINVTADSLNLNHTRIQGRSLTKIQTKHLEGSVNLNIEGQRLSYGLGSTNGNLRVQNMVKPFVARFFGEMRAYSAYYTNYFQLITTNQVTDPTDPTIITEELATNSFPFIIHLSMMQADMNTISPVFVDELFLTSTNMSVFDVFNITNGFNATGRSLTIEPSGSLSFSLGLQDWRSTNSPNVLNFTNRGSVFAVNNINLGQDRPLPFDSIVNQGTLTAASLDFRAKEFHNNGAISSTSGRIRIAADDATLDTGVSESASDTVWTGGGFKLRNYEVNSGRALLIDVTNYVEDAGAGSANIISVQDGIHFSRLPAKGSLLGTTIISTAPPFASVNNTWPGLDRGLSVDGFTNTAVNIALGRLELVTGLNSEIVFTGTGSANALYVDYLSLPTDNLDDLPNLLRLADNMVIYFADANIPAEELDGQLDGRLRWVSEYAGAESGMDILLGNGTVIRVNRGVRNSLNLDSDADGIPNGLDDAPFDGVAISSVSITSAPTLSAQISWEAAAGTVYTVEYATNILEANWQPLLNYTNNHSTNVTATIKDPINANSGQRYYRVTYTP